MGVSPSSPHVTLQRETNNFPKKLYISPREYFLRDTEAPSQRCGRSWTTMRQGSQRTFTKASSAMAKFQTVDRSQKPCTTRSSGFATLVYRSCLGFLLFTLVYEASYRIARICIVVDPSGTSFFLLDRACNVKIRNLIHPDNPGALRGENYIKTDHQISGNDTTNEDGTCHEKKANYKKGRTDSEVFLSKNKKHADQLATLPRGVFAITLITSYKTYITSRVSSSDRGETRKKRGCKTHVGSCHGSQLGVRIVRRGDLNNIGRDDEKTV